MNEALDGAFLQRALAVARRAAESAAAGIVARYRSQDFSVTVKADRTPVTEADRAAEATIREVLRSEFPTHGCFGEEEGRQGEGDFLWLVDPIDGTRAFVRGYPFFSTQIALMHRGELVLGFSNAPACDECAWAVRGGGAFLQQGDAAPVPLRVSACTEFGPDTAVSTGNLRTLAADPACWQALAGIVRRVGRIRGYGDFLHYHLLAHGAIDLVVESDLNILDIAALVVIVREAGGVFTELGGGPIGLATTSALAGPPAMHRLALAELGAPAAMQRR